MFGSYQSAVEKISKQAESYNEWISLAIAHDKEKGLDEWRESNHSNLYDYQEIETRLKKLRTLKAKGDEHGLLFTLNEGIHGNMGGMGNPKLYHKAVSGTKLLVAEYVEAVADCLWYIAEVDNEIISLEEKLDFLHRASHCFGRTALMLSGGGQLGNFHMGVLKSLIENDLLPNVISGSSAGSIFTALVGTKSKDELKEFFRPENLMVEVEKEKGLLSGIVRKRGTVKIDQVIETINRIIPDLSFQEAYELTGININISVAPRESLQKSRLLNAIASPNVMIRSAVLASCAIPGVFPAVTLLAQDKDGRQVPYLNSRKWVDGSMSNDLPAKRLSRLYGANHFIVSMTNPVVLPFFKDKPNEIEWVGAVKRFSTSLIKETSQFNYSLAKPFFKRWPKLALTANSINSVVQQNYLGDINIRADFSSIDPRHLLSALTYEEISSLIRKGEKETWPKLEQIRIATQIARILDHILSDFEHEELELASQALRERKRRKV
ncbi:MAG: DUF3336 domain-containing protein [Bacteroidia bacterium]|nr:DUF3336 domain-containing protein [Bacteroidia bacterium]